ncbi:RsmB/NOP family class I SAM-dependent RNA methyltransferase [Dyadobacter sp. CY343]|uniref:RsmB/NOP family class I SAM-dependent RNA methyltransferase n=1 Tax=Dyadobacter sp. CY343 TaxID=2907299 RepID=UPI001F2D2A3F|nr:RsmB/NOP family class I SAM-dependent RNA methyltransferase [Dyadobacter sp. CY343]MCE7060414.1 RsmB/NOP family class I SAM-dependent RNA methyltransferase [Dyadobacter sp. CY343]
MKIHRGLIFAVVEGLQHIFVRNRQADQVVEQLLKSNKKWGARDRSFIAENIYEIVRWWRLVKYVSQVEKAKEEADFVKLAGVWQLIKPLHLHSGEVIALPEWPEFGEINPEHVAVRYAEAMEIRKIGQSIPDWIDELGENELKKSWDKELKALNEQAQLILRVNTLKSNVTAVLELFGEDNAAPIENVPDAILLKKRQNINNTEAFKNGYIEVQDAGSQLIAPYLDIQPGLSVIDACAGAGGKSLHLAALLQNTGSILAMDIAGLKLNELKKRAERNGVTNLDTMTIQFDSDIEKLSETADRLLLDVPCSGLGVLRRNPDSKWKLKPEFLDQIRNVQWHILSTYSQMVKKGGKMVYATCSILPSESEDQVKRFMKTNRKEWELISQQRTSPAKDGFDGFYMALLQRKL